MEAKEFYEMLKKTHEPKGYFLNKNINLVFDLLDGLIINKERYGYMSCPCRLASGDREKDKDIICPCVYRQADVDKYGTCYCNLYVSRKWNDQEMEHVYVPERRQ